MHPAFPAHAIGGIFSAKRMYGGLVHTETTPEGLVDWAVAGDPSAKPRAGHCAEYHPHYTGTHEGNGGERCHAKTEAHVPFISSNVHSHREISSWKEELAIPWPEIDLKAGIAEKKRARGLRGLFIIY